MNEYSDSTVFDVNYFLAIVQEGFLDLFVHGTHLMEKFYSGL